MKTKRFCIESLQAALLVAFIVLLSSVTGWVLVVEYFSFYLALFFILLIPIWLLAFGIVFQAKWKWYSLLTGSLLAVFVLSLSFFAHAEDWQFRLVNSLVFAGVGGVSVLWGAAIGWLYRAIRANFSARKKEKQRSKEPSAPLGL